MEYLHQLAYIAMVLLIGTLASVLAYSLKTSDVFILLLTGMIFTRLGLLSFDRDIIIIISILALIFIVFNSSFRFRKKDIKKNFFPTFRLSITYLILCLLLAPAFHFTFDLEPTANNMLLSLLFSILAFGTDPSAILSIFKKSKNKIIEIIEIESIINTVLTITLSFLILTALGGSKFQITNQLSNPFLAVVQAIVIALLVALFSGWTVISILKNNYFGELTHLGVLTSAIIVYAGSEYLGGSGVLAISCYGIIFGNSKISHLIEIERFETIITNSIKILTFMLLGTIIVISPHYIIPGTLLFIFYLLIRFVSVIISYKKLALKKKIFLTLNVPKGVDVAVILLFIISLYTKIPNIGMLVNTVMLMALYSIALSSITSQFSKNLLKNVKKIKRD